MITRNNYEAYMLDLLEGQLSPQEETALNLFLKENPDLDDYLPETHHLEPSLNQFKHKEDLLFEEITTKNRSFFFISASEGLLTDEQLNQLQLFLSQHPEFEKEFEQYNRALLIADECTFDNKKALIFEQDKGLIIFFRPLRNIAAAIALLFLSYAALQLMTTDVTPLYTPQEIAAEIENYSSEQEKNRTESSAIKNPLKETNTQKNSFESKYSSPHIDMPNKSNSSLTPLPLAQQEKKPAGIKDSVILPNIEPPSNTPISENNIAIVTPEKSKSATKAPSVGEFLVKSAKDRLYKNPNAPQEDEFDSDLAALASAGISALSNKEQYINKNVNDAKKTKISIGGFTFQRIKH